MTNMNKYLGVKLVNASSCKENSFREEKGLLPEAENRDGYKVVYEDGYTSWSPKDVFEKAYKKFDETKFGIIIDVDTRTGNWYFVGIENDIAKTQNLSFGDAIESMKNGKKVARVGWNGKGMYLKLIQGYPVNGHLHPAMGKYHEDERTDDVTTAMFNIPETNPDGSPNITQGKPGQMLSYIVMKTAGYSDYWGEGFSDYVPWLASQTDILADDWVIV